MDTTPRRLLKVEEAARSLGLSRSALYPKITSGELASVTIGTARRVTPEALDEYVKGLQAAQAAQGEA